MRLVHGIGDLRRRISPEALDHVIVRDTCLVKMFFRFQKPCSSQESPRDGLSQVFGIAGPESLNDPLEGFLGLFRPAKLVERYGFVEQNLSAFLIRS